MSQKDLEKDFEKEMWGLVERIRKEAKYDPGFLSSMLHDTGGYDTAYRLIMRDKPSDGFIRLWEKGCLHLTAEAVVLENPKWQPLFEEGVLKMAKRRLAEYKYQLKK